MDVDFDGLTRHECHKLLVGMVVPRPIAWVSTTGENATFNVAPFSFFGAVSPKPPIICLSGGSRQGQKKDTLKNIEYTQDFVVNVVDEILAKRMNQTSADYPSNVDEFKEANITPLSSDRVVSPRIAEAPINMECKLLQTI
jgi:flavin reductase (DIM6/NTAB) family NADH-FMN oxidoreductase RutF